MDLDVSSDQLCQTLKDVRVMIKDHLLPRITDLEEEVRLLRGVCWPVCQSITEVNQLDGIIAKRKFLFDGGARNIDEIVELLKKKQTINIHIEKTPATYDEEYRRICNHKRV